MSAAGNARSMPAQLVPFRRGFDARRQQGPRLSPAELEFKACLEAEHIPKASDLLRRAFEQGMGGDVKAMELFFKVCGLIKKPSDDAAIQETAKALLGEMIVAAKARRDDPGSTG